MPRVDERLNLLPLLFGTLFLFLCVLVLPSHHFTLVSKLICFHLRSPSQDGLFGILTRKRVDPLSGAGLCILSSGTAEYILAFGYVSEVVFRRQNRRKTLLI